MNMKISEAIYKLESIRETHGDIRVFVCTTPSNEPLVRVQAKLLNLCTGPEGEDPIACFYDRTE
jgi:hypothetical protein